MREREKKERGGRGEERWCRQINDIRDEKSYKKEKLNNEIL